MRKPKGPLFPYYGAKWTLARKLGPPQRDTIVEPFAGSACYSTFWNSRRVILMDKDEVICGVWDFLIHASAAEIMSLPVEIDHVDEAHGLCAEAKFLIGFWFDPGCAKPAKRRGNWARTGAAGNVWSVTVRARIARDVEKIRHWRIICGSYENAPDLAAHWHIDPPYIEAGKEYRFGNEQIDYGALGEWCLERRGFTQVCEATGATWLPFERFAVTGGGRLGPHRPRFSREALFEHGQRRTSLPRPTLMEARYG